jgi:hypothetical protein
MLISTAEFRIPLFRKQRSQPQLLFQVFAHCVTSVNLTFGHVKRDKLWEILDSSFVYRVDPGLVGPM